MPAARRSMSSEAPARGSSLFVTCFRNGTAARSDAMRVLIAGGGVIGTSIAYFLARRGAEPIVIEPIGLACAASGKSGGFLALDWCDGTPLMQLARRSFGVHAELARELCGGWGYSRLTTYGGVVGRASGPVARRPGPGWVAPEVRITGQ